MSPTPTRDQDRILKWTGEVSEDVMTMKLNGDLDENANLAALRSMVSGHVRLDLAEVRRINSAGVREWVNFIREAEAICDSMTLVRCSPAFVAQMNMIFNFRGSADIASFFAPFVCSACDHEQDECIELTPEIRAGLPSRLPELRCSQCQAELEFDDIPERYFAFLTRD